MEKKNEQAAQEQIIQALWEQNQTYAFKDDGKKELFAVDTPPPTVSGSLHIGHIFSYTHTDIAARFERQQGKNVFYPMGFDDNGLATERFVEKKRQVSPFQLGRSNFIAVCQEETAIARQEFKALWQKLGLSVDWNISYSTINSRVQKISQESFVRLYQKGIIYRKHEPALFCTTCQTSVAQAELDDLEQPSTFNTIEFKTTDNEPLLIATTRPELLPACVALFYHPTDSRYAHLKNKKAVVPLFGHEVPILPDETVAPDKGTGLVMCCAFGDKTDIHWIKTHNLPYTLAIGLNGRFKEHTGPLAGLKVPEARKVVLGQLQAAGLLREQKPIMHSVNVHERCKKEIEYLTISQWFLKILDFKKEFIAAADKIEWHPAFMKTRYVNWVENLQWDWCLSRQRFYGIPFPVWHCRICGHILVAPVESLPVDPQEHVLFTHCSQCNGTEFAPDTDVMDTWNTSSLTPYICKSLYTNNTDHVFDDTQEHFIPMALRPQAHDIIRTWAFYTIAKTVLHNNTIPWKSIVISGHVLSENKEKFSKSKEQKKLDPTLLIDTYSADVIRYWTASGQLGHDVQFSEQQLKIGQRLVTKLINACKFIGEHTATADLTISNAQSLVNQWILHQLSTCFEQYKAHLTNRELSAALHAVENFFWKDFCDNYIEIVKHQLFNESLYDEQAVRETRQTIYYVGLRILQMYAPYIPHVTEQLFKQLYTRSCAYQSIHTMTFMVAQAEQTNAHAHTHMHAALTVIGAMRKLKTEAQLSLKTELQTLCVYSSDASIKKALSNIATLLKGVSCASALELCDKRDGIETKLESTSGAIKRI